MYVAYMFFDLDQNYYIRSFFLIYIFFQSGTWQIVLLLV